MGQLIPTPVTLEELIDESSDINTVNGGGKTQAISPRSSHTDTIIVAVTDDPFVANGYWVQKQLGGEWVRANAKTGNDVSVSYTLPVNLAVVNVHSVVYPIDLVDIATYPPIA